MDKLPDYLIENYIIPFLTSNELFFKIRPLSSYYYHCARVKILVKFPEEIMKSLKKILEYNTREDPTSAFQELVQKSISIKRLILIVNLQANPSLEINKILTNLRDERALRLIAFFYVLIKDENKQNLIRQEKYDEIQEISKTEDAIKDINEKIKESLNDEDLDFDINEHQIVYSSLDQSEKEYINAQADGYEEGYTIGQVIRTLVNKYYPNKEKVKEEKQKLDQSSIIVIATVVALVGATAISVLYILKNQKVIK